MLEAIKDLGETLLKENKKDRLSILVENVNSKGTYNTCLAIILNKGNENIEFFDVESEQFSEDKILRYLYRSGSANGPDTTPTAKLTEPSKTFNIKVLGWFKIVNDKNLNISKEDLEFLSKTKKALEDNKELIIQKIEEKRKEIPKKENIFITLKFKENGEEKYIGDYEVFKKLFLKIVEAKDLKIYAEERTCSICKEKKPVVIGNLDTYKFYTIDKPGFIAGGFKEKDAWKNFPVCLDCKMALEEGRKYIEENLVFNFAGIKYQLIPNFLFSSSSQDILDTLKNINKYKLTSQEKSRYLSDEKEILDYLKDEKDNLSLNFLFIKQIQAAERILLLIEDVFPSRLRKLYEAKDKVDSIFKDGSNNNLDQFTFSTLRTFFFKSDENKKDSDLDKYFFEIVEKIFKNRKIDKDFLINFFMKKIRKDFVLDNYFNFTVRKALMNILFLSELKLIDNKEEKMEEGLFDEFFSKFGDTFATPLKRGLFLLGVLTELLRRTQYNQRGSSPFMKNLKSLKMEEKDFKGLLPKIQNKLEEYGSFDKGKKTIAKEASNYLLAAGDNWKMSVDEMNFYFAAGMNLADEITKIVYTNKINEEEKNEWDN